MKLWYTVRNGIACAIQRLSVKMRNGVSNMKDLSKLNAYTLIKTEELPDAVVDMEALQVIKKIVHDFCSGKCE